MVPKKTFLSLSLWAKHNNKIVFIFACGCTWPELLVETTMRVDYKACIGWLVKASIYLLTLSSTWTTEYQGQPHMWTSSATERVPLSRHYSFWETPSKDRAHVRVPALVYRHRSR